MTENVRTEIQTTWATRKTAEKHARDYMALSDAPEGTEIGEDFEVKYWNGREHVPATLRYDVVYQQNVRTGKPTFQVVSTRTVLSQEA